VTLYSSSYTVTTRRHQSHPLRFAADDGLSTVILLIQPQKNTLLFPLDGITRGGRPMASLPVTPLVLSFNYEAHNAP